MNKFVLEYEENNELYLNMTTDDLRELSDDDLYQAVIYRLESKIEQYEDLEAGIESLTEIQKVSYVLNYYEIEVNNGGLCQFFVNSSHICAPYISDYLEIIGAVGHKEIYDRFIEKHKIDVYDLSSFVIKKTKDYTQQLARYPFHEFDENFYELESLEIKLIDYIRKHIEEY